VNQIGGPLGTRFGSLNKTVFARRRAEGRV
jgi:hypothetical protein